MTNPIRILFVEDVPADVVLVNHELRKAGLSVRTKRVDSRKAFIHELARQPPDVILSDHGLPAFDGFEALELAHERCPNVPFIFVTNSPREELAARAPKPGATDYVLKSELRRLAPAIQRALATGRTTAVEAASTEDKQYWQLVDLCPCALLVVNGRGEIVFSNAASARLLGAKSAESLCGKPLDAISPPPGGKFILQRVREAREAGDPFIEHEFVRMDGSRVAVELSAVPFVFRGRTALQIIAHDVSRRREAERALFESEARKAAMIEAALDAVVAIDAEGRVQEWNPAAEKIFGFGRQHALGRSVDELIIPDSLRRIYEGGVAKCLMTDSCNLVGRPIELTLRRADGSEFRAELAISRTGAGERKFCTALIRDITERKRVEAALHQSEERFRLLVEGVKDWAIYFLDVEGRVATWNSGAERLEGYRADEVMGKSVATFFSPEDVKSGVPEESLKRAAAEGQVRNEGWRVRKNGERFWSEGVLIALRDDAGKLRGFAKIAHDMTSKKRAEEEIRQLNTSLENRVAERTAELQAANQELEAFSYSVSHDLRAPLRHILGYVDILQSELEGDKNEAIQRHLVTVAQSAQQMNDLIEALLSFSRSGRAEMHQETVDLNQLVDEVQQQLAGELKDRRVQWRIASLPKTRGDRMMLRQVLMNLISNALKYTRRRDPARIEVGAVSEEEKIIFHVRDNGVGFDMKYADKLFGVFQRLHHADEFEGTGIGLAHVRRIIHRHGGRVWASSKPGEGATFFFSLPKLEKSMRTFVGKRLKNTS